MSEYIANTTIAPSRTSKPVRKMTAHDVMGGEEKLTEVDLGLNDATVEAIREFNGTVDRTVASSPSDSESDASGLTSWNVPNVKEKRLEEEADEYKLCRGVQRGPRELLAK